MTTKWRHSRVQRRNEARNLRRMSDIRKHVTRGPRTIWHLTADEQAAWEKWNDKHWSA